MSKIRIKNFDPIKEGYGEDDDMMDRRKAIVANTKNQFHCFQEVNLEQREYFMKMHKIRIQFEGEIIIQ